MNHDSGRTIEYLTILGPTRPNQTTIFPPCGHKVSFHHTYLLTSVVRQTFSAHLLNLRLGLMHATLTSIVLVRGTHARCQHRSSGIVLPSCGDIFMQRLRFSPGDILYSFLLNACFRFSYKRLKHQQESEFVMSDEDAPALPVDHLDDEFDLDIPPTSGQEYLRRVMYVSCSAT